MTEEAYRSPSINWNWYLHIRRLPGGGCDILRHYRLHQWKVEQGAGQEPRCDGEFRIVEGLGRIAEQVQLTYPDGRRETLEVGNPANVFSY